MTHSMSCKADSSYLTQVIRIVVSLLMIVLLAGCSSDQERWGKLLTEHQILTNNKLMKLQTMIEAQRIPNTQMLDIYAQTVASLEPDKAKLVNLLAADSRADGPMFSNLKQRLDVANSEVAGAPQLGQIATDELLSEFAAISSAADPQNFNMMLTDPLNVLADLSKGALPRVAALSQQASAQINKDAENYPGQQLVGNPQYGEWQTDSSGSSFWAWYGGYRLLGDLFDNRRISYNSWGRNRGYSYYNDYGRSAYTSPRQYKKQQAIDTRAKKKFQSSGKTFQSPYAKTRTGPAQAAAVAKAANSSSFRSSYSSSSTSTSSSRNASRSSSRSSSRSK